MYSNRFLLSISFLSISLFAFTQGNELHFSWKKLGPFSTPPSNVDSLQWTSTGVGWVEDLLILPNQWLAGSITGGLYSSKNEGKTWRKIDQDTPVQLGTLCLASKGNTIFRGTGLTHYDEDFGYGLFKSTNTGKSWEVAGLQFKAMDKKPLWGIDISNDSCIVACTPHSVYTSKDFSKTWEETFSGTKSDFRQVLFSQTDNRVAFVSGAFLLKSTSKGTTWVDITTKLSLFTNASLVPESEPIIGRIAICEDPNTPGRMLALYSFDKQTYVDESLDFGENWKNMYSSYALSRIDVHHAEIAIPPGNPNCIVIGGVRTYISIDRGKEFSQATFPFYKDSRFAHDDIRGLKLVSSDDFFLATDGGVFRSRDTGITWQNVSGKGLDIMQIYGIGLLKDNKIMLGAQDLGTFILDKKNWLNIGVLYGDGGDALERKDYFLTLSNGSVRQLSKHDLTRATFVHPPSGSNPFTGKLIPFPVSNSDSFYLVSSDVWLNTGAKWQKLNTSLANGEFKATGFDINKQDNQQLFLAFDQPTWNSSGVHNKFFKSTDGGQSWEDISSKLPILAWRHITAIASNPMNPLEIVISLGTMDDGEIHKAYKSSDGGNTWVNYSEGLLSYETFKLQYLEGTSCVFLSTLDGLYYRNTANLAWEKMNGRIPNVAIRDFEVAENQKFIYTATYGNGLWRVKIPKKLRKS